jgi:uncharacterized protein (TIGR02284 family)
MTAIGRSPEISVFSYYSGTGLGSELPILFWGATVANPSRDLLETEGVLRSIIETLIDGQEGFQKIADAMKDETLKQYFLSESLKRAEFRGELENILHLEGVHDIHQTGSPSGTFVRLWTGLEKALGAGSHALLQLAEDADRAAKERYDDALDKFLPAPVREVLLRQAAHVASSLMYVRDARAASA